MASTIDNELKWIKVFGEMSATLSSMISMMEKFESTLRKIPDDQIAITKELKNINETIIEIKTELESHSVVNLENKTTMEELNKSVEILNSLLSNIDPLTISRNKEILESMNDSICDVDIKSVIQSINDIINQYRGVLNEISIVMKSNQDTFQPAELYEILKFAKIGNVFVEWCKEKKKFIKFLMVVFGIVISSPAILLIKTIYQFFSK